METIKTLILEVSQLKIACPQPQTLAHFSPYLHQFHWCGGEEFLELPGQYTGDQDPSTTSSIKVYKFDNKITIYRTLRAPIKITIYGSNGKRYHYLVKHGEDLRQDQRIQQLLNLMSRQLETDRTCRNQRLSLQTYEVIPMSMTCGLLTFMDNVTPMKVFIEKCLERTNPSDDDVFHDLRTKYKQFIQRASWNDSDNTPSAQYAKAASHYTRENVKLKHYISNSSSDPIKQIVSLLDN